MRWLFSRGVVRSTEMGVSRFSYEPGARMPFGHRHKTQEEVYVVVAGSGARSSRTRSSTSACGTWCASRRRSSARSRRTGRDGADLRRRPRQARRRRTLRRLLARARVMAPDPDRMHRPAGVDAVVRALADMTAERVAGAPAVGPVAPPPSPPPVTVTAEGIGADRALQVWAEQLAPACIAVDHPRYLAFIPGAPTPLAGAFDMLVGASSIYGGSWMEGAGRGARRERGAAVDRRPRRPAGAGRRRVRLGRDGRQPVRARRGA